MTYIEKAHAKASSWVRHSGRTREEMAEAAGVSLDVIRRLKAGLPVSVASLQNIERSIPNNWRDPLPNNGEAA